MSPTTPTEPDATRQNTLLFSDGRITFRVDYWNGSEIPDPEEANRTVDHVLGTLHRAYGSGLDTLNGHIKSICPPTGRTTIADSRSLTLNGTSLRVKVSIRLNRTVEPFHLALVTRRVMAAAEACMVMALDGDALLAYVEKEVTDTMAGPDSMFAVPFPAGFDFGAMAGNGSRRAAADNGSPGQYL